MRAWFPSASGEFVAALKGAQHQFLAPTCCGAPEHGFSDDDVWDIAAIAAFFAMSNRLANFTSLRPNNEFYPLGRS